MMALKYDQWKTTPITSTTSITMSGLSLFGHTPPDGATPTSLRARASVRDRLLSLSLNGFDGERERRVADSLHRLKIQCFDLILYREENYDLKVSLACLHILSSRTYYFIPSQCMVYSISDICFLCSLIHLLPSRSNTVSPLRTIILSNTRPNTFSNLPSP